jgi:hypothetical protein
MGSHMAGVHINFHKSEVMVLGTSPKEHQQIVNLLNCKLGSFPFSYIRLPIGNRAMLASDWDPLGRKVTKRASSCMGKLMSSAARLILINACLSNLLMHAMGACLLGVGVHQTFNKHRSRFF